MMHDRTLGRCLEARKPTHVRPKPVDTTPYATAVVREGTSSGRIQQPRKSTHSGNPAFVSIKARRNNLAWHCVQRAEHNTHGQERAMQIRRVILSAALCAPAFAVVAQTTSTPKPDLRRVVEPGGMLDSTGSRIAACQPSRGDAVLVRGGQRQTQDLHSRVEVQVLTGQCQNTTGWVGSHRLAVANQ